jgi:hypothetical protein
LNLKLHHYEVKVSNLENRLKMRNANYYKSVVKEFFPKDTEKYREAIVSTELEEHKKHSCFCNFCGDDISSRAQS